MDPLETKIEGYTTIWPRYNRGSINNVPRILVFIKEDLNHKVRQDLMDEDSASIWLELSCNGGRKLLAGQVYREFQVLGQPRLDSASQQSQLNRWNSLVDNWRKAGKERDTVLLGDLNLDFQKWGRETGLRAKLISEVNNKIIIEGFSQLVDGPTWFQRGKHPACPWGAPAPHE